MCAFTWESAPVPWLFTTNTTLIHYFDFKSKHCGLKCFYPGKNQNPGVKYKFLGGVLLVRFVFQGLNIKFLEANRGLRNTVACQIDAFSEDCLDVFDLKQRCKTDRCVSSKYCKSYKRADVSFMLSLAVLWCHTPIGLQVKHPYLLSLVTCVIAASAVEKSCFFILRYYRKCN